MSKQGRHQVLAVRTLAAVVLVTQREAWHVVAVGQVATALGAAMGCGTVVATGRMCRPVPPGIGIWQSAGWGVA